jgi:DNA-binding HxlR family transcriptional regulator
MNSSTTAAEAQSKTAINEMMELLHRRWTLRILWELRREPLTFRELAQRSGQVSTSVLSVRLAELREALLITHDRAQGYALSEQGQSLMLACKPLMHWASQWHNQIIASREAESVIQKREDGGFD